HAAGAEDERDPGGARLREQQREAAEAELHVEPEALRRGRALVAAREGAEQADDEHGSGGGGRIERAREAAGCRPAGVLAAATVAGRDLRTGGDTGHDE